MSRYNTIVLEKENGIVRMTLNRPEKLNALSREMCLEIGEALDEIEGHPDFRVLVITGAGRAFCAGGDITELSEASSSVEAAQRRLRMSHSVATRLRDIRQPIIVALNGDAIGGGLSLALNGDLRVASEKARFGATFIRVGLVPGLGGIHNLPRLVGIGKACELAFLGEIIDAHEALRIGLINRVVAAEKAVEIATDWARRLSKSSAFALSLIKNALHKGLNADFGSELEDEINIQSLCLNSNNGKEGLTAFLEKRKPVFK